VHETQDYNLNMSNPILNLSATELSTAIRAGTLTVEDVVSAYLDQIDASNPAINAIISLRPRDEIMAEAAEMSRSDPTGALHGLPIAIKDLADTKDLRTTHGSPIFKDHIPKADSLMVSRLRQAGALIIGKTNTPEFGLGSHTYNPVSGPTRNPYDLTRSAGGSSGGAGAALAARMVPLADGSDMMGSLRNPAGWNNVYGFRPSYGLVPSNPVGEAFLHQLSTAGPMARSVEDLELLLRVMAGPDPRSPHSGATFTQMDARPVKGTRIGWIGDWGGYFPMEPGVLELCENGLATLADLGCDIEPLKPEFSPEKLWHSWITLRSWDIAGSYSYLYENPETRNLLKPELIWEIESDLSLSARDINNASEIRSEWFRSVAKMADIDIMALPSAQVFPFDVTLDWPREIAGRKMDTYHRWMEVVIPASLIGLPALSVPVGFGQNGLPMGLQLIGHRGSDARVLGLGHAYHQRTLWPQKHPPLLG